MTDLGDIVARADELYERSMSLLRDARGSAVHPRARRGEYQQLSPVSLQYLSSNRKVAPQRQEIARSGRVRNVPIGPYAATTYVSVSATCPGTCPFKDSGCYAQTGSYGWKIRRLDAAARKLHGFDVIEAEAALLDALYIRGVPQDGGAGGRDLRLHVSGDVSCERGTRVLAAAVERFQARGGGACWTYTHRWREVPESAWGPVSCLASVETAAELDAAVAAGYTPALVVESFPSTRVFSLPGSAVRVVPCRAETSNATCVECRLCLDPSLLRHGTAVGFALHGTGKAAAVSGLTRARAR